MLKLVIPGVGAAPLDRAFTVGLQESRQADVLIDDPYVSPVHLLFGVDLQGPWVENAGSLNATHMGVGVTEPRLHGRRHLCPGDQIVIGRTVLLVREQPPAEATITRL